MAKICPKCKTENPDNADFCKECRYKFSRLAEVKGTGRRVAHAAREEYEEHKGSIHGVVGSLLMFIIGAAVFSYLYYLTPIAKIVELFRQMIYGYIPEPWNTFFFNFMPIVLVLIFFGLWAISGLLSKKLDISFLPDFFYYTGVFLFAAGFMMGIGYLIYSYLLVGGMLDIYLCPLGSLLVKVDPNAAARCAGLGPETPENTKTGITILQESKFGSEYTDYTVPTIYKDEPYIIPLTIKNLDEENSLNNVYVYSANMQSEKESDKNIKLIPSVCTAGESCNIPAKTPQVISLESEKKIDFKAKDYIDITVVTKYPYVSFGKGEIFSVRSEPDLRTVEFPKPESGPGPVDTIVFFSPEYFLQTGKLSKVKMFITVVNKGKGEVEAKSIEINRLGKFEQLDTATCVVPGFKDTFNEGSKQEFEDLSFKSQIQFSCDVPIKASSSENENIPFQGIPFTATFEYNYIETLTDTFPVIQMS
jgi:hypothetical protein